MTAPRKGTVIAFYGDSKPAALAEMVADVQERLGKRLGGAFRPRRMDEVHATIIGLDALGPLSSFASLREPVDGRADGAGLLGYLADELERRRLTVQIGGFPDADLAISSRGSRLWQRTLTAHDDKVVLMGWPVDSAGVPTDALDGVRRGAQRFGFVHRYHSGAGDTDPDLYLVIGNVDRVDEAVEEALTATRADLAERACRVVLPVEAVRVAVYTDTRLPLDSTRTAPLACRAA